MARDLTDKEMLEHQIALGLAQRGAGRLGKKYERPPVIPEITKAYQQDPRTKLAVQAMAAGSSGDPVATGKYAYADGIARALTGVAGGYINKKQQDQYGAEEDQLRDTRWERGMRGLNEETGQPVPSTPQVTPVAPPAPVQQQSLPPPQTPLQAPVDPVKAQMADALLSAPDGLAGGPGAAPPAQGGGPVGQLPFSRPSSGGFDLSKGRDALKALGATVTSGYRTKKHNAEVGGVENSYHTRGTEDNPGAYDFTPKAGQSMAQLEAQARKAYPGYDIINEGDHVHVEPSRAMAVAGNSGGAAGGGNVPLADGGLGDLPALPEAVARPNRPDAVAATRSPLLRAAYKLMIDDNPYESAQGQEYYQGGLQEQGKLNENAAAREQSIRDDQYKNDYAVYAGSQDDARGYAYDVNKSARQNAFDAEQKRLDRISEESRASARIAAQATSDMAEATLPPETIRFMAGQLIAGDPTPMQNLGRGKSGAANAAALRTEMVRQAVEKGLTPQQLSAKNAQYFGEKAEARTVGGRIGAVAVAMEEVPPLSNEARTRHAALKGQNNLVPWNKAVQMVQSHTSSPELTAAVLANNAVVNAYARSFGSGVLAEGARKTAEKSLQAAWGTPGYNAALDQIQRNIEAERRGAGAALENVGGRAGGGAKPMTDAERLAKYGIK
jgi:hypothetical protein